MSKTMAEEARDQAIARGFKTRDPEPEIPKPAPGETFEHQPIAAAEPDAVSDEPALADPMPDSISMPARLPLPATDHRPPPFFPPQAIPSGLRFPKGLDVAFLRIRGELTSAKHKGDRYLVCWELSDGDDTMAYDRAQANVHRAVRERVKQMVRAVDGHPVTWAGGGPADLDLLWQDLGSKGRDLLFKLFNRLHVLTEEETADFFETSIGLVRMA